MPLLVADYVKSPSKRLVFILVYAFLIAIVGVPLLYLEFFLGQFSGSPMPNAFGGFPMAKGIGWTMVYMGALLAIFNTPITAYSFIYLTDCFSERLPWKWCPSNDSGAGDFAGNVTTPGVSAGGNVSSVSCYEIAQYQYPCARVNSTLARRYRSRNYTGPEAVSVPDAIGGPVVVVPKAEYVALRNACIHGNLSSQEYYLRKEVLNLTSTIAELGAIQPRVALSMAICWFLGFLITIKGHRSLAIVSMVSVYAKVALLLSLSIAALTLSGALHGVTTCLKPDLLKLFKIQTWDKAASLLFYTVGLSLGTTTCFASYNNFQADILRYSVMVPLADFGYSLLSTVFVFSLYGHVAQSYDVEVSDVVTTGCVQYGFITFPESVSSRYEGRLWCSAFYTLLFLLNNSQMVIMEGVLGTVKDIYPGLRRRVPLVALLACSAGFLISLPTAYQGGYYLTDLVYTILSSDLIPWIGFAQLVTVVYAYGTDKLLGDITFMFDRPPPRYLPFCWRYICPVALAGIGLYTHTVARDPTARTAQQEFIDWSTVYQVVIMAVAVVLIGSFVASELGKHKNAVPRLFLGQRHTDMATWGDPPIPAFEPRYPRGWFFTFEAALWLNHTLLLELRRVLVLPPPSATPYDDLRAAVLTHYGFSDNRSRPPAEEVPAQPTHASQQGIVPSAPSASSPASSVAPLDLISTVNGVLPNALGTCPVDGGFGSVQTLVGTLALACLAVDALSRGVMPPTRYEPAEQF
ncbi:sodium- and chloride-dependent glycine transporter 1-like [Haemaphysalis longicornis]